MDLYSGCACHNLRKAARAVTGLYERIIFPTTGIHAPQVTLLMALASVEEITVTRLAGRLVIDRTTLARDLKPLQEQGFVTVRAGADRRTRLVRLTAPGAAKVEQIRPLWQVAQEQIIAHGLGAARWKRLYDDLQEVVRLSHT